MSIFGWSLPPGCGTLPGEEYGTIDLSQRVTVLMGEECFAYWGEDDALWACRKTDLTSSECEVPKIGEWSWCDEESEDDNKHGAALRCASLLRGQA